jgi:arylsulfatase A-like enzyme
MSGWYTTWTWGTGVAAVAVIALLAGNAGCEPEGQPTAGRPTPVSTPRTEDNLVLITIDTLRADHLGCYGYARNTTPRIDELAAEGTVFTQAEVHWPKTAPSIASMMSSTYCATNKVRRLRVRLDDRVIMLAEILHDAGFYTGAFVANVNIGKYFNFTQGFRDVYECWEHGNRVKTSNEGTVFWSNERIAEQVASWLREHHEKRLFLWVHLLDPHGPYLPPEAFAQRFVGDKIYQRRPELPPPARIPRYQRPGGHRTVADYVAAYDAEIVSSDAAAGLIRDELQALGMGDTSLVVISADHGESLGEHDYYFNHGKYAYEACTRVPLVFWRPGVVPSAARVDTPVPLLDLVPTLLELLNVAPGPAARQFQGQSFAYVFRGEPLKPQPIFIESRAGQNAVRNGRWKFIRDPRKPTRNVPVVAQQQLYDLHLDPAETRNIIGDRPRIAAGMGRLLAQWQQVVRNSKLIDRAERISDDQLDPAVLDQLRSLGYIGDANGE